MEARAFPGDVRALVSPRLERRGVLAAFTERTGGVSRGPYSSLNLGAETGDAPAAIEANRTRVAEALDIEAFTAARQVHGANVAPVERSGREPGDADALTTSRPSVPLAIMTADCAPVALANELDRRLAVVHIGWRGLASGILRAALGVFGSADEVVAAIGPAIGPCHYEVGQEVVEAVRRGTGEDAVVHRGGGRTRLDIRGTVEKLLRLEGVTDLDRTDACTACEPERFFSHRRDGLTGRQALVAVLL